ncbi:ArsI/CadI family heavy metal resistance metalloenzyme [Atopomonas sediminilitoris]|uniref:ArsI/CadI family heavy metal resistance metalloenzyme n=1 Tax=Atopomonas sediminilitoris TaxID=2919919 RepID=UPI001F4EBB67|nr:ArsI/CadI family heavy metal resistance metalloenzyme [Atopomonas sediminilitoris]MCJ8167897.1 glyoxalase/bleomycin resistance/dioxygenase family protein [Atopomonas sediminilitoris]
MKRLHIHVSVAELSSAISFYQQLFAAEPSVVKDDYAKWMLDDPRVNFAISTRSGKTGLDHLGIQAENADELAELEQRANAAGNPVRPENGACCYMESNKYWTVDPAGIPWEQFHSLHEVPTFNGSADAKSSTSACCAPSEKPATPAPSASSCCSPKSGCC